jgi:cell wall-associated NlpC family hydrolase
VHVLSKQRKPIICLMFMLLMLMCSVAFASFGYGDRGDEVVSIQKRLVELSYDVGGVDGSFGQGTETAVKAFQRANGLEEDGVVGETTYRALMNRDMPVNRSGARTSALRNVLRTAYNMEGVPYVFGGTTPYGFDCSGFTQYCFASAGISLSRMADSQYYESTRISTSELRPGDLVFFSTYADGASHVGIYVGDGRFIHAGTSTGVAVSNLFDGYWGNCYIGAGRVM